ncbi:unnamed protein product [Amoebophrya sp. A25]|nr:unnamed protein product [Amoebophrya sp. A25]|eukprot:GSA25T00024354001.1
MLLFSCRILFCVTNEKHVKNIINFLVTFLRFCSMIIYTTDQLHQSNIEEYIADIIDNMKNICLSNDFDLLTALDEN